ncbi:peptidoglycan-binding protein [Patescibacteria group bacterium]|nr:peptidoglycan-binding protein [Patescibacteria group bacterium]MBU4023189.1 peptidoglycan-binding protein [Patescibacteria group bacterium]MBU4078480.1 peptidoglycan-binding protein [Patescibacteria group bacterium]
MLKLSLKKLKPKKESFPKLGLLKFLPKILDKKERYIFSVLFLIFLISGIVLTINLWQTNTELIPANGGILREGVVGQPRFINPVYGSSNDSDRDLINLIYSGLFEYDSQGNLLPDLVSDYIIEDDNKTYLLTLRQDVVFHDKIPLTVDDVIFTIKTIQNPDFQSPIQAQWLDVEAEKISDFQLKLFLKNPYPAFLETLTLKILPSHIWKDVSSQNFPLYSYNFEPIGSGAFKIKNVSRDSAGKINSVALEKFSQYYGKKPYLNEISFIFFNNQNELHQAAQNNIIDAFSPMSLSDYKEIYKFDEHSFILPRYYALFFNSKEKELLTSDKVRLALNYAIDKEEIKKEILNNNGSIVNSPFLPELYQFQLPNASSTFDSEKALALFREDGFEEQEGKLVKIKSAETMKFSSTIQSGARGSVVKYLQECLSSLDDRIYPEKEITSYFGAKTKDAVIRFQQEYADEILTPSGLTVGNGIVGPSTREKLNQVCIIAPAEIIPLEITITTSQDPMLNQTAEIIKEQWQKIGISVEIESLPIAKIKQEIIKERDYHALLFGQVLGIIPDPFPFWHSSQRVYPGLNLAYFKDSSVDKLLESARTETDLSKKFENYAEAQEILLKQSPAIFLYNPSYLYLVAEKIKGIEPGLIADSCQRFAEIENWYIKTKRVLK